MLIFLAINSLPNRRTSGGAELSATALIPADVLSSLPNSLRERKRGAAQRPRLGDVPANRLSARISKDNPFRKDSERPFSENGALVSGAAKMMDQEPRRALAWKVLRVGMLVAGVVLGASLCRRAERSWVRKPEDVRIGRCRLPIDFQPLHSRTHSWPPISWHACYEHWRRVEFARRRVVAARASLQFEPILSFSTLKSS
jgi:hypothetical protein